MKKDLEFQIKIRMVFKHKRNINIKNLLIMFLLSYLNH